jgi:hypothetical protein
MSLKASNISRTNQSGSLPPKKKKKTKKEKIPLDAHPPKTK